MRLTILGRGPSWRECLFDTEELWGTVTCLTIPELREKKFTKVFYFDDSETPENRAGLAIAEQRNIQILSMVGDVGDKYPLRDVIRDCRASYFLNTISYMMAYAIHLKYSRIFLHGIDQGPVWELQQAKPHVCFWIGFANGRGIEVTMGRGSLRWAYNIGEKPPPEAETVVVNEVLCESV